MTAARDKSRPRPKGPASEAPVSLAPPARPLPPAGDPRDAAVLTGDLSDPFGYFGLQPDPAGGFVLRTFQPGAEAVALIDGRTGAVVLELERRHEGGLFAGRLPDATLPFPYRLRIRRRGVEAEIEDPYRFPPVLGELDVHLLAEGRHQRIYERLGAHPTEIEGIAGTSFAVWAPSARRVSVVGDFNAWDGRVHPMRLRHDCGVWEIFLPGVSQGALYKYEIKGPSGALLPLKADPLAFRAERPPRTASVVHGLPGHDWGDAEWMEGRKAHQDRAAPISVYEVHLGSWRRVPEEDNRSLTYTELADRLIPYVLEMGFTHVELLPITEFPFDGSWGYQPIGLYAATSRFGQPEDFQAFVDRCHQAGLGVILDWVPAHFPTDGHGLAYFDGTHLYEHADPRQGFHLDWNTLIYNLGRREVANFLICNALFWLDQYHLDGLRVDAVASMLYLDYSRGPGQWIANRYGGRENLEAIDFLRRLNEEVYGRFPGAITVAEESTAWPAVSRPTYAGGLGFGFKWNMGWMHDTLDYMSQDPVHRRWHHHELTFGLLYAFTENFVLPLSHDEVVHGKRALLEKMPGDDWQKFANLRAYLTFMWTHPGKKLLFMGGEFAQRSEWHHDSSLDWHLLQYDSHRGIQATVRDLNRLYRTTPALYELDGENQGFEWIEAGDGDNSVLAYLRRDTKGRPVAIVCNFTPVPRLAYRIGVPEGGMWLERHNSDAAVYGGSGVGNDGRVMADAQGAHGRPFSLALTLPPLAALVLEPEGTAV